MSGTGTVTISSGAATFSVAQTGNIGVGDRVTYNTSSVAYIAAKTNPDQKHWSLVTATGGTPADISNSTVVSIKHEYTTLEGAVSGASDTNHVGNSGDLTAGTGVILNIACYIDAGSADTTAVTVSGYTTSATNYIKIYTPYNTSTEANQSQRHQGKWDDGKYSLVPDTDVNDAMDINDNYITVDGLQMHTTNIINNAGDNVDIEGPSTQIRLSNNIFRADTSNYNEPGGVSIYWGVGSTYIWNNIYYDFVNNSAQGIMNEGAETYIYNNTFYNVDIGIWNDSNTAVAKNNIFANVTTPTIGRFVADTDYNITNDSSIGTGGAHDKTNVTVQFADAAADDFHLSSQDTAAKDAGTDLSDDPNLAFNTDIDGQTRPQGLAWDIGADEAIAAAAALGGSADTSVAPVAYYNFNEGVGSTAYNSGTGGASLNGMLGTGSSAPTWTNDGKFGKALSFNGTSDYIDAGTAPSVKQLTTITVGAWIKPLGQGGSGYGRIASTGDYEMFINNSNTDIKFLVWNDSGGYANPVVSNCYSMSNWNYIAFTMDGTKLTPYCNGVAQAPVNWPGGSIKNTASNHLIIGNNPPNGGAWFNGTIDEVKIWNYALSTDQVKREYDGGSVEQFGSSGSISGTGKPTNAGSGDYCVPGDTTSCAAPIAEYKMDEGTGTIAYDTSGDGNDGTISGTTWTQGKYGKALSFDGSSSLAVSDSISTRANGDFSVSAWVKANAYSTGNQPQIAQSGNSGCYYAWDLRSTTDNHFQMAVEDSGCSYTWATAADTYNLGQWYYVVGTWNNTTGTVTLYIDGVQIDQKTPDNGRLNSDSGILIGGACSGGNCYWQEGWNGTIDQVRVYNYARTPAQVAWEYNHGGPVLSYRFNECTGATVHDESGNGNNGTINLGSSGQTATGSCSVNANTPWYNGRSGKYGASLNFDGTDDYVQGTSATFSGDFAGSYCAWVKLNDVSSSQTIISQGDNGSFQGFGMFVGIRGTGVISAEFYGDHPVYTGDVISANSWNHICITKSPGAIDSTTSIYLNGSLQTTSCSDSDTPNFVGTYPVYIGTDMVSTGTPLDSATGSIDDVKIFNYALTPTQIQTLYNDNSAVNFGN
jgi:hypothetical protein